MPVDFTGYWKMLTNENFEEYLRALGKAAWPSPGPSRRTPHRKAERATERDHRLRLARSRAIRGDQRQVSASWLWMWVI
jgi:hypothetical protein